MTKFHLRRFRALSLLLLGAMMLVTFVPKNTYAATSLQGNDFQAQSFSKTVDYYDYVRQYAAANNINYTAIQSQHAYIYTTYINVGGFQLFYAGLLNATHNNMNVTIPIHTVFEHFKTPQGKDAITASSFLSLVAFTENGTSTMFPNSPDRSDTVFASFSLGYPLSAFGTHPVPTYVANSQIIPLTSTDSNHWTWGLNYTNLNAIWWRMYPDPLLPLWDASTPRAFAQYSQLSFTYALAIDPSAKTATLTTSYTVGRMTDLYLLTTSPRVLHLNSTGTYDLSGVSRGTQSGYQLYNYASGNQANYNVTTRTANRPAWGGNPVYGVQNVFMGFLPLFVYHVDPALFQVARTGMASFRVASYLYIISYPTWSGYKIVNDPQYEAFYEPTNNVGLLTALFIAVAVAAGIGGVFAFLFRRRRTPATTIVGTTAPSQSPGPLVRPSGPSQ